MVHPETVIRRVVAWGQAYELTFERPGKWTGKTIWESSARLVSIRPVSDRGLEGAAIDEAAAAKAVIRASREAAGVSESSHSDNRGSPTVPGPPLLADAIARVEEVATHMEFYARLYNQAAAKRGQPSFDGDKLAEEAAALRVVIAAARRTETLGETLQVADATTDEVSELASDIRGDWTDPRAECRAIHEAVSRYRAARAALAPEKEEGR